MKLKTKIKKKPLQQEKYKIFGGGDLKIVDIDSVKVWEKNPRKNEKGIDRLAKLILKYGQRTPISVWQENMKIYKGNTTWLAMKKAGFKKIAVILQNFKDEREAIGYAASDNKAGEWSDWDETLLAELLQSESFSDLGSSEISKLTGFDDKDLKGLLLSSTELPDTLPDVDLTGTIPDKADYMVIQFEGKPEYQKFKKRLGFETKHPRVVPYKDLLTVMEWIHEDEEIKPLRQKSRILKFKKRTDR
jgi:hypothetical protein